jgi:hypothetical protein
MKMYLDMAMEADRVMNDWWGDEWGPCRVKHVGEGTLVITPLYSEGAEQSREKLFFGPSKHKVWISQMSVGVEATDEEGRKYVFSLYPDDYGGKGCNNPPGLSPPDFQI